MAMYAYRDKERKNEVKAELVSLEDKSTVFYCPERSCNAEMILVSVDGISTTHFRAKSKMGHIEGCPYHKNNSEFKPKDYYEKEFDFNSIVENLMIKSKCKHRTSKAINIGESEIKNNSVNTIKQLYSLCKYYPCTAHYNRNTIGFMLLDDRSSYMYSRGVWNYKIVEAKSEAYFYNRKKKEIYLASPFYIKKFKLILSFADEKLFQEVQQIIYNNQGKRIIFAGEWKYLGYNSACTNFISKKQFTIIK